MSQTAPNEVCSALNCLVIACRNDALAFDAAALIIDDRWRKERLKEQSRRRAAFRHELKANVVALGGAPATQASYAARVAALLRLLKGAVAGKHSGDAYAACSRTETQTEAVYAAALLLDLPGEIRSGVLRQHGEIEADRRDFRRLRWDNATLLQTIYASESRSDRTAQEPIAASSDEGVYVRSI